MPYRQRCVLSSDLPNKGVVDYTYARLYADVTGANSTGVGGKTGLGVIVQDFWTAHANLIWSPVPRADIGVQYTYAYNGYINSANGTAHRVQASFKYHFQVTEICLNLCQPNTGPAT